MTNCPQCDREVYDDSCLCGWRMPKVLPKHAEPPKFKSSPSVVVAREFAKEEEKVNAYIAKYRVKYPGVSKRQICMAILKKKGLVDFLPPAVRHEAEREARAEREAITAES